MSLTPALTDYSSIEKTSLFPRIFAAFIAAMVKPWHDVQRMKVLLLGITGGFSVSILSFSVQYHIAQQGFWEPSFYLAFQIPLCGFLGIALSFICMTLPEGRWILGLGQLCGLLLFLHWPSLPLASALATMLLHTPFWAGYHVRFATCRSQGNHGSETALSSLLFLWSGAAGTIAGGWLLQNNMYATALICGTLLILLSTQLLYKRIKAESFFRKSLLLLRRRRVSSRLTILNGIVGTTSDYTLPVWLIAVGMSPWIGGVMLATRPVLGFLITPLIGPMIHKGGRHALVAGAALTAVGWLSIGVAAFLTSSPFAFLPGFAFLAVGSNLTGPAEVSRWYKTRSATGIVARENGLSFGRMAALPLLLPLAFFAPHAYPLAACGLALLFVGVAFMGKSKLFAEPAAVTKPSPTPVSMMQEV